MQVRYRDRPDITGHSNAFNMAGLGEVIVYFDDGDATSSEVGELEVFVMESWRDMRSSFRAQLLEVTDDGRSFHATRGGAVKS